MINIVTKGPELGACAGKGSLSYGNYDYWRVDGMINAPLGDKAAVRLDGVWQRRGGFIDNATAGEPDINDRDRSEEHTSELPSLMRISYAVFCLTKKIIPTHTNIILTNSHLTTHTSDQH